METVYTKRFIKTEYDLPKEESYYYFHKRISKDEIVIFTNHVIGDEEYEVLTFDWYLEPRELPTEEGFKSEIINKLKAGKIHPNPLTSGEVNVIQVCYNWLRDKIKE
jgi:hypothetical protein